MEFIRRDDLDGHYVCNVEHMVNRKNVLTTVVENMKQFTKRQNKRIQLVKEFLKRMPMSAEMLKYIVSKGAIDKLPFDIQDILLSMEKILVT
jgi:hypothetical protein